MMHNCYSLSFFISLIIFANLTSADDTPCLSRKEEGGYICVCNETYCDTVESPTPLPRGSYYHYMTSEDSPGFTKNTGTFDKSAATKCRDNTISSDVYIVVNSDVQYQTFSGFGASFTTSSGILISNLPFETQQKLIESYFGPNGIEYSLARVPIASSDFSPEQYTYDDVPGDNDLKYFNLTKYDFLHKIPYIKMAMSASERGVKLLASPWTAPPWMKTNNSPVPGYLRTQYYQEYANYLLKFLESYSDNGIDFWGITQGNEVIIALFFGGVFDFPNTIMTPSQIRYWVTRNLGPTIRGSRFKNIKLFCLDDVRPFLPWSAKRILADKEASKFIDGVALHWYFDFNSTTPFLDNFHTEFPDKLILYTESSINTFQTGSKPVLLGDWSRAVRYINNIFQNLGHWVVGFIDWNLVLNEDGGPTGILKMPLDSSVIVNVTSGEFYKQPFFYALGHFSKFISPGSKIVQVKVMQDSVDVGNEENFSKSLEEWIKMIRNNIGNPPKSSPPLSTTTASPFPTRKPDPPSNTVLALATTNPDGSHTLIAYNPRSEPANLVITDLEMGTFYQTVQAHSLNTFIYW